VSTFLKPSQVDLSLLDEVEGHAAYVRNATIIESVGVDEERATTICDALPTDPEVGPYLRYLHDRSLP